MNCNEIRELMPDLAAGLSAVTPETSNHLESCASCAGQLEEFRQTMALLDEWKAPEDTSPYFMTRLKARMREEAAKEAAPGWLSWFRKPVLAVSMVLLLVMSIAFFQGGSKPPSKPSVSAVNDLQYLDKNSDVLQSLEMLDDLGDNTTATP